MLNIWIRRFEYAYKNGQARGHELPFISELKSDLLRDIEKYFDMYCIIRKRYPDLERSTREFPTLELGAKGYIMALGSGGIPPTGPMPLGGGRHFNQPNTGGSEGPAVRAEAVEREIQVHF